MNQLYITREKKLDMFNYTRQKKEKCETSATTDDASMLESPLKQIRGMMYQVA